MAGQEHFGIRLDTDKLQQDAEKAKKAFDGIAQAAAGAGETVDNALGSGAQMAAGKFNMLNMSIQQIARELPSLTISPQMFFLAISNNLPIFTDALANARNEFNAMTAAGQKAIPVWKQVAKSLFSWQTAISLLPTLLILYGDEIEEFFSKLFEGSKKVDYTAESMKRVSDAMLKGEQDAQKELTTLRLLYDATTDVTKSVEDRRKAADELQRLYPSYFENLSDEEIMAGRAATAYKNLSDAIIESAKARAAQEQIQENYKEIIKLEKEQAEAEQAREKAVAKRTKAEERVQGVIYGGEAGIEARRVAYQYLSEVQSEVEEYGNKATEAAEKIKAFNEENKKLAAGIKVSDLVTEQGKPTKVNEPQNESVDKVKQYLNELLGLQEDNEERQIELTKTGTERQIALIELRYTRQIEAVKKLQAELTKAQGGTLTAEQQGIFETAISGLGKQQINEIKAIENEQLQAERKAMQDYLAEYGEYWEKRKAIAEKYQDAIAKATTEGERKSLQAEMTEALAKLDDEAQKKTSIIVKLFGDMSKKTVDEMRKIADEAEKLLAFIEGGEYKSGNSFGITEEQFKILSQSPEKLESIKNEIATVRAEADKAEPIFERIKDSLTDLFKNGGKEGNLNKNLQNLSKDVSAVMQSVGFLADSFGKLGDAFGGGIFSGIAEGLNMAMDTVNSAMQGAQAGSMFGPIGAAAGAAFGAVSSLVGAITQIHDKKKEKQIQRLQKQIDQLAKSYDDLGREVDKAYSKDASELIEQQNVALEQQKVLILKQIESEKDKKDTDWGRIEKWEQQIEDINNTIEDNKEKAVDVIFGEDVQSAIERFSSALTDAWANGTNAAQGTKDAVKQMMQQMVQESIKAAIQSSKSMEEIRQKLQEFYADEVLSGWEQDYIYNMANKLQEEINKQFGWAEDLFKDKGSTTTQTATAGGFETMSQDSADELNGRFTALYESNLRIETQINVGNIELGNIRNIATEMRDIAQNCYFELIEIRENTGAIVKPIQQMQKDIAVVKQNTAKL